jgi:pimeloyl-ACP methyl ester carboxylesterase
VEWARHLIDLRPQYVERIGARDIRDHVVVVNSAGMPVTVRDGPVLWRARSPLGRLLRRFEPLPDAFEEWTRYDALLKAMMRQIRKEQKTVMIIVHGGLESPHQNLANSAAILEQIHTQGDRVYPIFIIWDSYLGALPEQLLLVRSGHYTAWWFVTGLYYLISATWSGIGLLFSMGATQVRSLYRGGPLYSDPPTGGGGALGVSLGDYQPKRRTLAGSVLQFVGWLLQAIPRIVSSVFINGLAPPTWQNLRRRARAMFRAPQEFDELVSSRTAVPSGSSFHPSRGAVAVLVRRLSETIGRDSARPGKVTLIAHSMGSMITNEFIKYAGDRLWYDAIVYMAPACSVKDFADAVVPALERDRAAHAYVLTLHPKVEVNEKTGRGFLPRGSILEWLERFLDPPVTHLDRALGKFDNVRRALHIFPTRVRKRIHVKAFPFDGNRPRKPFKHIHFNDQSTRFWRRAFWM